MKSSRICIIGGLGFLGKNLYSRLKNHNDIYIIDILDKYEEENIHYFSFQKEGFDLLKKHKFDYIYFCAGSASAGRSVKDPIYDLLQNTKMLLEILELIKTKKTKFIFASSAACYGEMSTQNDQYPISPYGISKLAAENYLKFYYNTYGTPVLICRYFSLFGEYQKKQVIYDTTIKLLKNPEKLEIYNPQHERDFIYIDDAIRLTLQLSELDVYHAIPVDIGTGNTCSILGLTELISSILNVKPILSFKNVDSPGVPHKQIADIYKLKELDLYTKYNLQQGLSKTIHWIKEQR